MTEQLIGITDRIKFSVIRVNTNQIITTDLLFTDATVTVNLSSPSRSQIKIPQPEQFRSAAGIDWKTWKYWIIPEIGIGNQRKFLGAQLLTRVDIDPQSGELNLEATGFLGYPKGIPFLQDYNPIAEDPATIIQTVWAHLQNFTNANLGISVQPNKLNVLMTPGYSFDGNVLNFDFYCIFLRAVDFQDSGDIINSLARDLPLDMLEEVTWTGSLPNKVVRLGYPQLGYKRTALNFKMGENVLSAELADELEIEPVSDVIIRGWRPGSTYSSQLNIETINAELVAAGKPQLVADPLERVRRTIMEEDANIDSTERAQAWARRRLTRRNIPRSFKKIMIDPNHPNGPIDDFWLADSIYVQAASYPWIGEIKGWHRVTSLTFKANELPVEVGLKVDGAFNYDPIGYVPYSESNPTADLNKLSNGYFGKNTAGWNIIEGQWFRLTQAGYRSPGCMRVDCDDINGEFYESHKISANPSQQFSVSAWVRRQEIVKRTGANAYTSTAGGIFIATRGYLKGELKTGIVKLAALPDPEGTGPWTELKGTITMPSNGSLDQFTVMLCANQLQGGITWWDDVRVLAL